jgi:hypothetical protein
MEKKLRDLQSEGRAARLQIVSRLGHSELIQKATKDSK